jgi:DNA-binding CsgD family transcriptional regulator
MHERGAWQASGRLVELLSSRALLRRPDVLSIVRGAVDFDHAALVPRTPTAPEQIFKRGDWPDRFRRGDLQYRADVQPVTQYARAHGGVAVDTVVFSRTDRCRRAFYADIVRPQRIRTLGFVVLPQGDGHATLTLARTGHRSYSEQEVRALRLLQPLLTLSERLLCAWPPFEELSPRESEIAGYACLGHRNVDIALACGCSENTVRNHLKSIFRKLHIANRTELAAVWRRFGAT